MGSWVSKLIKEQECPRRGYISSFIFSTPGFYYSQTRLSIADNTQPDFDYIHDNRPLAGQAGAGGIKGTAEGRARAFPVLTIDIDTH